MCSAKSFFKVIVLVSIVIQAFTTHARTPSKNQSDQQMINGQTWFDTKGIPINAHGGCILLHKGVYYWYGEIKSGETLLVKDLNWECYRTNAGGVSCYSSKNLTDWKYEGVALQPNLKDSTHDLHISGVQERPKVVYNKRTRKFVLWLHVDKQDYSYARAGVAVSDSPVGPFNYIGSYRPNNSMSRDMTLYKDDDERAYLIYSSENNATMHICLLSDDYLQPTTVFKRAFVNQYREAPAVFKQNNNYYIITSGCTGWSPNKAMLAVSDSLMGDWRMLYNPCKGEMSDLTFGAQSAFVLPLGKKNRNFVFVADLWEKTNLPQSKYLWLPIVIEKDSLHIPWQKAYKRK